MCIVCRLRIKWTVEDIGVDKFFSLIGIVLLSYVKLGKTLIRTLIFLIFSCFTSGYSDRFTRTSIDLETLKLMKIQTLQ